MIPPSPFRHARGSKTLAAVTPWNRGERGRRERREKRREKRVCMVYDVWL
jgi:hypothetical protein